LKNKLETQILARRILEVIHFQEAFKQTKLTVIPQKIISILPKTVDNP
jgi:hypothetical protein